MLVHWRVLRIVSQPQLRAALLFFKQHPELNNYQIIKKVLNKTSKVVEDKVTEFFKYPNGDICVISNKSLGSGVSSVVYPGVMLRTGEKIVVKKFRPEFKNLEDAEKEAAALRKRYDKDLNIKYNSVAKNKDTEKDEVGFLERIAVVQPQKLKKNPNDVDDLRVWIIEKKLPGYDGDRYVKKEVKRRKRKSPLAKINPRKAAKFVKKKFADKKKKERKRALSQMSVVREGEPDPAETIQNQILFTEPPLKKINEYKEQYAIDDQETLLNDVDSFLDRLYSASLGMGWKFVGGLESLTPFDKIKDFKVFSWNPIPYEQIEDVEIPANQRAGFLSKLYTLTEMAESLCSNDAVLMEQNSIDLDSKLANVKIAEIQNRLFDRVKQFLFKERVQYSISPMDAGEVVELPADEKILILHETYPHGTPGFLSAHNEALYNYVSDNKKVIEYARRILAIKEILEERKSANLPKIYEDKNFIEKMQAIATIPPYKFNLESATAATALMIEKLTRIDFDYIPFDYWRLPSQLNSETNDPYVALLNQFVKIIAKMLNPEVTHDYTSIKALDDFAVFKQRIKAMHQTEQQLNNPTEYHFGAPLRRITSHLKPYLGASLRAAAADEKLAKNIIKTLAVDLDPRKYTIQTNSLQAVYIKDVTTHKTVSSIAIIKDLASDQRFVEVKLSDDEELIANNLRATAALAEKGKPIILSDSAHDPAYAIKVKKIAEDLADKEKLQIKLEWDPKTADAVKQFLLDHPDHLTLTTPVPPATPPGPS